MIANKENLVLEPGKTIDYVEGEILNVRFSKWGIYGKLKIKNQTFNYSLKDLDFSKNVIIGLDLIIEKGFCIKNKKGEIVITDGKFGNANIKLKLKRYYYLEEKRKKILTGIIRLIDKTNNNTIFEIEQFIPPHHIERCIIFSTNKETFEKMIDTNINKIVRIKGKLNESNFEVESFELLPENHFWYKFVEIRDYQPEQIDNFSQIITQQMELVDNLYESFRKFIFNVWRDVSKSSLITFKEILYSKIFSGEIKTPYNILISNNDIKNYFDAMLDFCTNSDFIKNNFEEPGDFILYLENFYPSYKLLH